LFKVTLRHRTIV